MQGSASVFGNVPQTPFQEKDDKKNEIMAQIDKYDATMLSYLARLYEAINGDKMDFTKIKSAVDALATFNKRAEYNYLNNLLYPEKCKGVKIPSPIPVPSCSFQLHNCVTLTTNHHGNLAFVFNPFFLANSNDLTKLNNTPIFPGSELKYDKVDYLSSFWVNNSSNLTGNVPNDEWVPMNIGQTIPNVYDQYRLVSASLVVKYIGRLDVTSGVIGGAIIYEDNKNIGAHVDYSEGEGVPGFSRNTVNSGLSKFGNFDLAMDSFYHQENLCLEGMRELYFPLDNSYEEYTKLAGTSQIEPYNDIILMDKEGIGFSIKDTDAYKSGFNMFVYVLGAPPANACFKVDIYCNFECLPNASFLNYLPLSMNAGTISNIEKKNAIATVQQQPITSLKNSNSLVATKPSIWEKLKSKFANSLPGIGKLLSWGLGTMIPGLKPGLALAGSLLESANNQGNNMVEEEVE